jgi:hypothetical protein
LLALAYRPEWDVFSDEDIVKKTEPFLFLMIGFNDPDNAGDFLEGLLDAGDVPESREEPFRVRNSHSNCVYVFDPWAATDEVASRVSRLAVDTGVLECRSPNVDIVRTLPSLSDGDHVEDWGTGTFNQVLFVQGRVDVWPQIQHFGRLPLRARRALGGSHDAYVAWTYPNGGALRRIQGEWPEGMCGPDSYLSSSKAACGVMFSRQVLVDKRGAPTHLRVSVMTMDARWRDADPDQDDAFFFTANRFTVDMPPLSRRFNYPPIEDMPSRFRAAMRLAVHGYESNCATRGLDLVPRIIEGERGRGQRA